MMSALFAEGKCPDEFYQAVKALVSRAKAK